MGGEEMGSCRRGGWRDERRPVGRRGSARWSAEGPMERSPSSSISRTASHRRRRCGGGRRTPCTGGRRAPASVFPTDMAGHMEARRRGGARRRRGAGGDDTGAREQGSGSSLLSVRRRGSRGARRRRQRPLRGAASRHVPPPRRAHLTNAAREEAHAITCAVSRVIAAHPGPFPRRAPDTAVLPTPPASPTSATSASPSSASPTRTCTDSSLPAPHRHRQADADAGLPAPRHHRQADPAASDAPNSKNLTLGLLCQGLQLEQIAVTSARPRARPAGRLQTCSCSIVGEANGRAAGAGDKEKAWPERRAYSWLLALAKISGMREFLVDLRSQEEPVVADPNGRHGTQIQNKNSHRKHKIICNQDQT
uniref:Uncharacterized protein n=1 Tax=Oryza sativa subsp. japonica TaxID=39947 RepID=Q69Y83_ORYSJ|nr:hypothetical protein [Oryza sativa Japonica Group]